jgi:hypothetical protein
MRLSHRLKAKYRHKIEKKYAKTIKRKQLNFNYSEDIILGVQFMVAILEVLRYVIAEHLLQLGSYHLIGVMKDRERREKLAEQLVKVHLLGGELSDGEDVLRLGDQN